MVLPRQHGLIVVKVDSHIRVHLTHLEADLVAQRRVLRATSSGNMPLTSLTPWNRTSNTDQGTSPYADRRR